VVDFTVQFIAELLLRRGLRWLIPAVPVLGLPPQTLTSFCTVDPPAVPTFTSTDTNALLQLQFGPAFDVALEKMRDLVLNQLWYEVCQCTSVATPAAPTPAAPPAGTPVATDPYVKAQTMCGFIGTTTMSTSIAAGGGNFGDFIIANYPNLRFMRLHYVRESDGVGPHQNSTLQVVWGNGSPVFFEAFQTFPPDGIWRTLDIPMRPGYTTVNSIGLLSTSDSTDNFNLYAELFCGSPGTGEAGCCPPDPALMATMEIILKQVNLIQRQAAPFGYVPGATHAGLNGLGQFDVADLVGARITVTDFPSSTYGTSAGVPPLWWNLGWFNWGTDDGFLPREWLTQEETLSLPPAAGVYTKFAFSLNPGVVVQLVELKREP
jgi:hypothetical protein